MAFYRLYPIADTFITNAFPQYAPGASRAVGSNLGSSPTLQVYKLNDGKQISRALIKFDLTSLSGVVPLSGAVWHLKCFDYKTGNPNPTSFDLDVAAISGAWDEGIGQDDIEFIDYGYANWLSASSNTGWVNAGGDYFSGTLVSQHFDLGDEDLDVDVTPLVQSWLTGGANNGFLIKLKDVQEQDSADYFRKYFYSSHTHTVASMPYLEARWDDVRKDNRGNFAVGLPNTLFLYNAGRDELIDAVEPVTVRVQNNFLSESSTYQSTFSASRVEKGTYSTSINFPFLPNTLLFSSSVSGSVSGGFVTSSFTSSFTASWIDVWVDASGSALMTGTFNPVARQASFARAQQFYHVTIANLKRLYEMNETARLIVRVRKDYSFSPLARHTASLDAPLDYQENMFFSVVSADTEDVVVPFGSGSIPYTKLSYDKYGNYFFLPMNCFVPGFTYKIVFLIKQDKLAATLIDDNFEFKVL